MVINPRIRHAFEEFYHWFAHKFRFSEHTVLILLAFLVGVTTGVGAVAFRWLVLTMKDLFIGTGLDVLSGKGTLFPRYTVPLIPMIGGFLVGPITYYFAREAKGHGVPEVMAAVALKGGVIRPRMVSAKAFSSALCIGTGGSAGREGPIVAIGSAIGSTIGTLFRMSGERVKVLVGCGAAAGISAVFNAPIAGVLFALEIILGDFAIHTFSPVILSSVIATVISHYFVGDFPAFEVPKYNLVSAWEIPMYSLMGFVCGVIAVVFTTLLYKSEDIFEEKVKLHPAIKPALGGLMVGIIGFFFPQIFSDGYEVITAALHGNLAWNLLFILVFLKIIATSLTLGSGSSGGIFAPSLFIGAMTGGSFGILMNSLFPAVTASPGAYALVGMSAVVAGTTHAPITAILILFEMTNDYRIILPLMIASVFSTLVAHRLKNESIYTLKLIRRGIRIKGGKDVMLLDSIRVAEVMKKDYKSVPPEMTLRQLLHYMEENGDDCYPVIDRYGTLKGAVAMQDVRTIITKEGMQDLIIVSDIIGSQPITVNPESSLREALQLFGMRDISILPVVDPHQKEHIMGVLYRRDVLNTYHRRLLQKESS
ncbi:MAG: CBS domain-containing protein [candidate division Zixibacteria bacterium]|nr:CBS domain-containing protein [candidate division Zixibacteria bacterium]